MTGIQFLAEWALRSSILILITALLLLALRVKAPAIVLTVWTAVLCGSLAIPAIQAILPQMPIAILRAAPASPPPTPLRLSHTPISATEPEPVEPVSFTPVPRTSSASFDWARAGILFYIVVAAALLFRLLAGLRTSRRWLRESLPAREATGGIQIRESDRVVSPVALGILRPAIVLPLDWREWDDAKLNAVLAHERSHIHRHDPLVQLLSSIHRALLWCSPMSWYLHRRIIRVAEEASDDAAIDATSDRVSYAEVLMEFMQRGIRNTGWQGVPMARYCEPEKRIHRILDSTFLSHRVTRWTATAIVLLAAPLAYVVAAARPEHPLAPPPAPAPAVAAAIPAPLPTPPAQTQSSPVQTASPTASAAPADKSLTFEAASVKPFVPPPPGPGGRKGGGGGGPMAGGPGTPDPSRIHYGAATLMDLLLRAYDVKGFQVIGPDWLNAERYTIDATESPDTTVEQFRTMLQNLLAQRFKLAAHWENREHEVYALTIAKGGSKLKESSATPPAETPPVAGADLRKMQFDADGFPIMAMQPGRPWRFIMYGRHRIGGTQVTMQDLAEQLTTELRSPVSDETRLQGKYDYQMTYSLEGFVDPALALRPGPPPPAADDHNGIPSPDSLPPLPSLFTVMQSQLGLKLDAKKGGLQTLIIDHIERTPTDN